MKKIEADFIVSGEVVGQRPMSQQKSLFALIEKQSKTQQLILRPLSAKLLPPIKVQQQGLIDEQYLLDIYGRGRGRQLALADELGLTEYPTPSGGCLLTDPGFSRRLRDLLRHCPEFNYKQIELLRLGRHFRLSAKTKLVVARDASECQELIRLAGDNKRVELVMPQEAKGPLAVINKGANLASLKLAASIVASYCRYRQKNLEVKIGNKKVEVSLKPRRREIKKFLI
jgi:tRNA U34 2-thiouridine synthase MnmA/TrmU